MCIVRAILANYLLTTEYRVKSVIGHSKKRYSVQKITFKRARTTSLWSTNYRWSLDQKVPVQKLLSDCPLQYIVDPLKWTHQQEHHQYYNNQDTSFYNACNSLPIQSGRPLNHAGPFL